MGGRAGKAWFAVDDLLLIVEALGEVQEGRERSWSAEKVMVESRQRAEGNLDVGFEARRAKMSRLA